ncbi:MAG: transketolase [Planctomycetales bacterium]|nr:transketolase [Planctomycetales bacterium]
MLRIGWEKPDLEAVDLEGLEKLRRECGADIVRMTTLATCGHPGGSLSCLHILLTLYSNMRHDPVAPLDPERDRLVVSNGHISPGVYSVLARAGYVRPEQVLLGFRRAGSPFGGHVEPKVPGVEWATGNLGQGFAAAVGSALATKLRGSRATTFCLMGDGEQQKGQISEARRIAVKFGLTNLVGIVDRNRLQIGGKTDEIMPQNVNEEWEAGGWNVLDLEDGHDFGLVYKTLRRAVRREVDRPDRPTVVVARTVMGKGIPFIENDHKYHGSALGPADAGKALVLFGAAADPAAAAADLAAWTDRRKGAPPAWPLPPRETARATLDPGTPVDYTPSTAPDMRSAYGKVLEDLAKRNNATGAPPKVLAFTCDLEESVKMGGIKKATPGAFFECGVQEHATASVAGRLSHEGYVVFFSTFGVFGVDEVYNQLRLNDFNEASLKVVCTHMGLSVGEDGPTHQSVDYLALLGGLFGFRIAIPADPNQTDRVIRHVATTPGNWFVGLPRAKTGVVVNSDGTPRYGGAWKYVPGEADRIAEGSDAAILAIGPMVTNALEARRLLKESSGIEASVWNFVSIEPFPASAVIEAARTGVVVTVEDHSVWGGLGTRVAERLAMVPPIVLRKLGVRGYQTSGPYQDLYEAAGLSPKGIADAVDAAVRTARPRRPNGGGGK